MISPADIIIDCNGTVRSKQYNDIYFSPDNGIAESTYVYLQGSGLTDKIHKDTTVLETGFGTGLNLLLTLHTWDTAPEKADLTYISIEKHPICLSDLKHIYSFLPPYLKLYADCLLKNYPPLESGIHSFKVRNATVILYFNDVMDVLHSISHTIDIFYLDGFAPNKNADMWQESLFENLYAISSPSSVLTTFTSATPVRKAIEKAGFIVEKRAGFGRKRECLTAAKNIFPTPEPFESVAIIGAGIMGCWIAYYLQKMGKKVTLYDTSDAPMQKTSGNPIALLNPSFTNQNGALRDFQRNAFMYAISAYNCDEMPDIWAVKGVTKYPSKNHPADRLLQWHTHQNISAKDIQYNKKTQSIFFPRLGAVYPAKIAQHLTQDIQFVGNTTIDDIDSFKKETDADRVIITTGYMAESLTKTSYPNSFTVGQCEYIENITPYVNADTNADIKTNININADMGATNTESHKTKIPPAYVTLQKAASENGYGIISGNAMVFGAAFDRTENFDDLPVFPIAPRTDWQTDNIAKIPRVFSISPAADDCISKTGIRANPKGYLPVIHSISDSVLCITAMGAKGFLTAPYVASIVCHSILTNTSPIAQSLLKKLVQLDR